MPSRWTLDMIPDTIFKAETNTKNRINRSVSTNKTNTNTTNYGIKRKLAFGSEFEQLYYEINKVIQNSKDPLFTAYLKDTLIEAQQNPESAMDLRDKVIANYGTYVKRMEASGQSVDRYYFRSIYGDMDTPEIKKSI